MAVIDAKDIVCPGCNKVIAREDRRKTRVGMLSALHGAKLSSVPNQAPRIKCPCGKVLILMKGSL